ncbi:hypothetical protein MKX03_036111 [Papaver bracteatum]|nr:hypothetical protein MKX03_036111 [Papaver bracteatum]
MEMTRFLGTTTSNSFAKPIINTNFSVPLPVNTSRRALTVTCKFMGAHSRRTRNGFLTYSHRKTRRGEHFQRNGDINPVDRFTVLHGDYTQIPLSMTVSTVIDTMDGPLYFGGPLDVKLVLISHKKNSNDDGVILSRSGFFKEVLEGLHYGTKQESLYCVDEMIKRNEIGVEDFRVFEGYCKWTNKLLRHEIRTGHWKVIACSPTYLVHLILKNLNTDMETLNFKAKNI